MLAAVRFIEKYRSHLEGQEFVLRVDNPALKWLKTYSMSSDIVARRISILSAFKMRIEHRLRDKHFNADGLSKKTEYYEEKEENYRNKPAISPGFSFISQEAYDQLETVPWLNKDGNEIQEEEKMNKTETLRILKQDDSLALEAAFPCTKTQPDKQTEKF